MQESLPIQKLARHQLPIELDILGPGSNIFRDCQIMRIQTQTAHAFRITLAVDLPAGHANLAAVSLSPHRVSRVIRPAARSTWSTSRFFIDFLDLVARQQTYERHRLAQSI